METSSPWARLQLAIALPAQRLRERERRPQAPKKTSWSLKMCFPLDLSPNTIGSPLTVTTRHNYMFRFGNKPSFVTFAG